MRMESQTADILQRLLSAPGSTVTTSEREFGRWRRCFYAEAAPWPVPVDRAVIGGFIADCTAYAFAAGYGAALQALVPGLPGDKIACFCITEEGGGHPRFIKTSLAPAGGGAEGGKRWTVTGRKKFITCAAEADLFLVAASTGPSPDGKNQIRMVTVRRETPGIEIQLMRNLRLVPEISHGEVFFREVSVQAADLLPGDGYLEYIKPFRTIEDLHVSAAILGHLFRKARRHAWPREIREAIIGAIVSVRALATSDPGLASVHIAVHEALGRIKELLVRLEPLWDRIGGKEKEDWDRDKVLMSIADTARTRRIETAWKQYGVLE
ncbi:MAG: acyl-CoA dehydrogenase family protein [Thermodesulfobacteriota bacterium]